MENRFSSLNFVLSVSHYSVDHLIVAFTVVMADKDLKNGQISVHNFEQSIVKLTLNSVNLSDLQ